MSDRPPGAGPKESADPGHFQRQGAYDDPQASLVHDDGQAPGDVAAGDTPPPESDAATALRDPDYRAWRAEQLAALPTSDAVAREMQARAYDDAYLRWREAPGADFSAWREALASARLPAVGAAPARYPDRR